MRDVIDIQSAGRQVRGTHRPPDLLGHRPQHLVAGLEGIATWTRPNGGYFISVELPRGTAATVVQLSGEAGVKLTPAGSTFPYGKDPDDSNIRLAPTYPTLEEIHQAMPVFLTATKLAFARQRLEHS